MRKTVLGLLIASLAALGAAAPALAQEIGADPRAQLPSPLMEGEELVPLRGGCRMIIPTPKTSDHRANARKMRWYGACRLGLAHGPGYFGISSPDKPDSFTPATMRWGRATPNPITWTPIEELKAFPRRAGADSEWYFKMQPSPQASEAADTKEGFGPIFGSVFDRNGAYTSNLIAYVNHKDGQKTVTDLVSVTKNPCPTIVGSGYSIPKSLAEHDPPFTAEQQKLLRPYCQQAYTTVKREPFNRGQYFYDFDRVNYGYYFVVATRRETKMIGPDGAEGPATNENVEVTVCPVFLDINSCQPAWTKQLAPYMEAREAARKRELEYRAGEEAARVQRIKAQNAYMAPFEAAWRAKVRAMTAQLAGPTSPAPSSGKH